MKNRCAFLLLFEAIAIGFSYSCFGSSFTREIASINALSEQKAYHEAQETALSLLAMDLEPNDKIKITETLINVYFSEKNYSGAIKYLKFLEDFSTDDAQKLKYTEKIADTYYTDKKYSFADVYYRYLHAKTGNDEYLFREICSIIKSNAYDSLEKNISENLQFKDPEIEIKSWVNIAIYLFDEYKFERLFFYLNQIISRGEKFYDTEYSAELVYIYSQCLVRLDLIDRAKKILSEAIGRTKSSNTRDVERLYFALLELALKDNEFEIAYQVEQELKVRFPMHNTEFLRFYIRKYFYEEKFYESHVILDDNLEVLKHDKECLLLHLFLQMHFEMISLEDFEQKIKIFENDKNLQIKARYLHARVLKRWNKFQDAKKIYSEILTDETCTRETELACNLQKIKCDLALRKYKIPIKFAKNNLLLQEILQETKNTLLKFESFYISYLWTNEKNTNDQNLNVLYNKYILPNLNSFETKNPAIQFWKEKIMNAFQ